MSILPKNGLSLFLGSALMLFASFAASASETKVLVSADGRGTLEPIVSDHSGLAVGGLAQRATVINEQRSTNDDVLLLEAGDFLFGQYGNETTTPVIVDAYKAMNYDAVNLAVADFREGKAYTMDLLQSAKLPVVTSNLFHSQGGKPLFEKFYIIKKGGKKTAVIGLTEPPLARSMFSHFDKQLGGIYIQPLREALVTLLPEVEKRADHIVILYAGSSAGFRQVCHSNSEKINVIATSGVGPVAASTTKKIQVLSPVPGGRDLACCVINKDLSVDKARSIVMEPSIAAEPKIRNILSQSNHPKPDESGEANFLTSFQNNQFLQLPANPERNRLYKLTGLMSNRGADIRILGAGLFDEFGALKAREGHVLLVLRSSWENTIPLIHRRNQALATTYLIPNLGNHLYAVVNGKCMSRIYRGKTNIPNDLPVAPLRLPYIGMQEEGNIVFELEDEVMDSIDLRMYDYAHGHAQYDLLGERPIAEDSIQPMAKNQVIEAGVFEFTQSDAIDSVPAEPGMVFISVDFRATSQFVIDGDATAFDPHAKAGARIDIGTVADWLEADKYTHLLVDGNYAVKPIEAFNKVGANPRFLPDLKTGNRLVFQVPAEHQSLNLRADFPNALLPDGSLIRPEPLQFQLSGTTPEYETIDPIWQVKDDTMTVLITKSEIVEEFSGTMAGEGKSFLVLDVDLEGVGDKPEFFQANSQIVSFDSQGRKSLPHPLTFKGAKRPTETIWVPNGEHRICQLVFEVEAAETEHRISYQGYSLAETVALTSDGSVKAVPTESEGIIPRPVKQDPVVAQQLEETSNVVARSNVEVIEQEPEEIISLVPYHLEKPKALKALLDNDLNARMETARSGEFLQNDYCSYADFSTKFGNSENIDTEAIEDEKSVSYQIIAGKVYEGVLAIKDEDVYQFEVTEEQAKEAFNLYLSYQEGEKPLKFQIKKERRTIHQQYVSKAEAIQQIKFEPGRYELEIYHNSNAADMKYRLFLEAVDLIAESEMEFNESFETATRIDLNKTISGRQSVGTRYDYFKFHVDETAATNVYLLDVISDNAEVGFSVTIYDDLHHNIQDVDAKNGVVSIHNFSPVEGDYYLLVLRDKKDFSYQLSISEVGPYVPGIEREPNDTHQGRTKAVISNTDKEGPEISGVFNGHEQDFFMLDVKDSSKVFTLSLSGENVSEIRYLNPAGRTKMDVYANDELDLAPALVDVKLPVGLNMFMVRGEDCDWAVNIESFDVPGGNFEEEPNNDESWATNVKLGEIYSGRLLDSRDEDYFKVIIHKAGNYRFKVTPGNGSRISMLIYGLGAGSERFDMKESQGCLEPTVYLLPGQYRFYLESIEPSLAKYELSVIPVFDGNPSDEVSIEIQLDSTTVAEHSDLFQSVRGTLRISNYLQTRLEGGLHLGSTNDDVNFISKNEEHVILEKGHSVDIPVEVQIAANTWSHSKVYLYAQLKTEEGIVFLSDQCLMTFDPDLLSVGSEHIRQSDLLPELVGGFNLALLVFGAVPIEEEKENYPFDDSPPGNNYLETLFDGVIERDSFRGHRAVVKLAGDGTIPLVGTSFDLHGEGSLWESAKEILVELSNDGTTWNPVLEVALEAKKGNQQFVFPQEIAAQYARLTIKSSHFSEDTPHFGEWRMIGKPGVPLHEQTFDLLESRYGGHEIIKTDTSRVYGFHHNRAAKIDGLGWKVKYPSHGKYKNVCEARLLLSMDSPVGPWTPFGEFDVSAADNDEETPTLVKFDAPTWARFVKVEWDGPLEEGIQIVEPEIVSLTESQHSQDYFSILGEWGDSHSKAGYEYGQKRELETITHINSSQENPYTLILDKTLSSAASIGEEWEDWIRIEPLESEKRIELKLHSEPFIKVAVDITNIDGKSIDVSTKLNGSKERIYRFMAEPGMEYRVHIYEPKRSIVFLWDVSGSMSNFVPSIENAILQFATAVNPGTEIVHLLPFEDKPKFLLKEWTGDPYLLSDTVRRYDAPDSSYAHINLLEATNKLKDQKGTKAAIVITDCESSRNVNSILWEALEDVRPVVFTFQTSDRTSHYSEEQDDMQDWASVAGGFYRCTRDASELDVAFEKVKVFLRRPAPYTLGFSTPELKPGFIEIVDVRPEETLIHPEEDGIMLLIDASASMREKLPDGKMKVSVAKEMIEKMVTEYLPSETNFGLRVFGHRGGENCKSELMLPLEPINPETIKQKLLFMRPSSLGNTSLAEGISWAKEDFGTIVGNKRLVVLTDGEETCQGDPAAEIAKLTEQGLEVMVNIVGFSLGDESTKTDYDNWVKSTDGSYYDAQDSDALGTALQNAMMPKQLPEFLILDKDGNEIASGTVGDDPVEVKSGSYVVKILDPDVPATHHIEVMENVIVLKYE